MNKRHSHLQKTPRIYYGAVSGERIAAWLNRDGKGKQLPTHAAVGRVEKIVNLLQAIALPEGGEGFKDDEVRELAAIFKPYRFRVELWWGSDKDKRRILPEPRYVAMGHHESEGYAISYLFELCRRGLHHRLRHCKWCKRWFYARFAHQTHCTG